MKLMINGYEVTIKARGRWSKKASEKDAMEFLNDVSIWASESAKYNREKGYEGLAESYDKAGYEIYKALEDAGLYDKLAD